MEISVPSSLHYSAEYVSSLKAVRGGRGQSPTSFLLWSPRDTVVRGVSVISVRPRETEDHDWWLSLPGSTSQSSTHHISEPGTGGDINTTMVLISVLAEMPRAKAWEEKRIRVNPSSENKASAAKVISGTCFRFPGIFMFLGGLGTRGFASCVAWDENHQLGWNLGLSSQQK